MDKFQKARVQNQIFIFRCIAEGLEHEDGNAFAFKVFYELNDSHPNYNGLMLKAINYLNDHAEFEWVINEYNQLSDADTTIKSGYFLHLASKYAEIGNIKAINYCLFIHYSAAFVYNIITKKTIENVIQVIKHEDDNVEENTSDTNKISRVLIIIGDKILLNTLTLNDSLKSFCLATILTTKNEKTRRSCKRILEIGEKKEQTTIMKKKHGIGVETSD